MLIEDVKKLSPLDRFCYWVRERYQIFLRRRAGKPKPWTDDVILQNYFFTNPYRENDKVTQWFREHVRDPLRDDSAVVFATVCFRWFNWIPTGELLLKHNLLTDWSPTRCQQVLEGRSKIFTGAFMINSPGGEPKLGAIVRRVNNVWQDREALLQDAAQWKTMQQAHQRLSQYDGLGGFMAYEIVCDLRYTRWLEGAMDKLTWSNPGPGAVRGLYRILGRDFPKGNNATSPPIPKDWSEQTQRLLSIWKTRMPKLPPPEAREVEMSLCESDKYDRALFGDGRLKRRFAGL
jgi:hypothetical protein